VQAAGEHVAGVAAGGGGGEGYLQGELLGKGPQVEQPAEGAVIFGDLGWVSEGASLGFLGGDSVFWPAKIAGVGRSVVGGSNFLEDYWNCFWVLMGWTIGKGQRDWMKAYNGIHCVDTQCPCFLRLASAAH
jgi:hypothetical protein